MKIPKLFKKAAAFVMAAVTALRKKQKGRTPKPKKSKKKKAKCSKEVNNAENS